MSTIRDRRHSRAGTASTARRPLVAIVLGAVAVVIGTAAAIWAWTRPIGHDPYTTYPITYPTRPEYLVIITIAGIALAVLGLLVIIIATVIRALGRPSRSTTA